MNENLTENEKAALYYHIFTGVTDRLTLYAIAVGPDKVNTLTEGSRKVMAANWFRAHKIKKALETITAEIEKSKENLILEGFRKAAGESNAENTTPDEILKKGVNFLNPDEFLTFANDQANRITDEKERRAYLELIAKLMNYKDKDGENGDIMRFYVPLSCQNCPLYEQEKAKEL